MKTIMICLLISFPAFAKPGHCASSGGVQKCSKYAGGLAIKTIIGILCSKGDCAKEGNNIMCSKEPGGGAMKVGFGQVKCTGGCERPRAEYCSDLE